MNKLFLAKVNSILPIWKEVNHLNAALNCLYPITIAFGDKLYVYDFDEIENKYTHIMTELSPVPLPTKRLRAAFPLDFYENKCSAVVNVDCFDNLSEIILLFHEFVHCFQFSTIEPDLRSSLRLNQISIDEGNMMWELNYKFPYDNDEVKGLLQLFLVNSSYDLVSLHQDLKLILSDIDYEYMIWQEWKEGYARYVENMLQRYFNVEINMLDRHSSLDRTVFYELGCRWFMKQGDDIEEGFWNMLKV